MFITSLHTRLRLMQWWLLLGCIVTSEVGAFYFTVCRLVQFLLAVWKWDVKRSQTSTLILASFSLCHLHSKTPSVLWHCWLSGRTGIWPEKNNWHVAMLMAVICLRENDCIFQSSIVTTITFLMSSSNNNNNAIYIAQIRVQQQMGCQMMSV